MDSAQRIPIAGRLGLCGMLALVLRTAVVWLPLMLLAWLAYRRRVG